MAFAHLLHAAAAPHAALVHAAARSALDTPTPCRDWDLRALVNHLLYWTPVLAAAGRHEAPTPAAPTEGEADLVIGNWAATLDAHREDLVAAWSEPAAWDGEVSMGGPNPLPAEMVGGIVLCELVLHGWDLGRTLGQRPEWPEDVLAGTLATVDRLAPQGRAMGAFGPEVAAPADAPTLERVVALSGRDPGWAPVDAG
jgi:uncharacterized protein (TIGR03086 family)